MTVNCVFIENLRIDCVIGVHDWERHSRQRILISVEMDTDFSAAATADELADSLDYSAVCAAIDGIARDGHFQLIEALAERIVEHLLNNYPITRVRITVAKPGALGQADAAGVRIERVREAG